mgnify:CR=1 FL=1
MKIKVYNPNKIFYVKYKLIGNKSILNNHNLMSNQTKDSNFIEKISIGKNMSIRKSYKKQIEINNDIINRSRNKTELSIIEGKPSIRNQQQDSARKKSALIINSFEYYRNYFNLLFQAFKINSEKQEIFENVKNLFLLNFT